MEMARAWGRPRTAIGQRGTGTWRTVGRSFMEAAGGRLGGGARRSPPSRVGRRLSVLLDVDAVLVLRRHCKVRSGYCDVIYILNKCNKYCIYFIWMLHFE